MSVPHKVDWCKAATRAALASMRADEVVDRIGADLADDTALERAARAVLADGDDALAAFCRQLQKRVRALNA